MQSSCSLTVKTLNSPRTDLFVSLNCVEDKMVQNSNLILFENRLGHLALLWVTDIPIPILNVG